MRRFSWFVMGTIAGALIGSVLTLLITPESGEQLQAKARDRIGNLRGEIQQAYESRMKQMEGELAALSQGESPEDSA